MAKKSNTRFYEMKITPASGGAHVETVHATKRSGQGGGPSVEYEPEPSVHTTRQSLLEHVDKHTKHLWPEGMNEIEKADDAEETPED